MAVVVNQYTLGTATATLICGAHHMAQDVTIHNQNKTASQYVFLGNADVTTSNGIHVDPGATMQLKLQANDVLYATTNHEGCVVAVLQSLQ